MTSEQARGSSLLSNPHGRRGEDAYQNIGLAMHDQLVACSTPHTIVLANGASCFYRGLSFNIRVAVLYLCVVGNFLVADVMIRSHLRGLF